MSSPTSLPSSPPPQLPSPGGFPISPPPPSISSPPAPSLAATLPKLHTPQQPTLPNKPPLSAMLAEPKEEPMSLVQQPVSKPQPVSHSKPQALAQSKAAPTMQQSVIQQPPKVPHIPASMPQIQPQAKISHPPPSQPPQLIPVSSLETKPKSPVMSMSIPSSVIERPSLDPPVKFMIGDDDIPSAPNSGSNSRTNSRPGSPAIKQETGKS